MLKTTLLDLRDLRTAQSFGGIVVHRNTSKEPLNRERRNAGGVLQSINQTYQYVAKQGAQF